MGLGCRGPVAENVGFRHMHKYPCTEDRRKLERCRDRFDEEIALAEHTPICNFGWKAPSFSLPGVDGKTYSLDGLKGENGTLVMFICNHCPYVKAVIDRIVRDANELKRYGINTVAISSNDVDALPRRLLRQHEAVREEHGFTFPYLYDESQECRPRL